MIAKRTYVAPVDASMVSRYPRTTSHGPRPARREARCRGGQVATRRPSHMAAPTWLCGRRRCSRRSPTTPRPRSWSGSTRTGNLYDGSRSCARGRSRPRSRIHDPDRCVADHDKKVDPTWYNPAVNGWGSGGRP
jgi:hypothetical protein